MQNIMKSVKIEREWLSSLATLLTDGYLTKLKIGEKRMITHRKAFQKKDNLITKN